MHVLITHSSNSCKLWLFDHLIILSTPFISAIWIIFVGWVIGLFRSFRYFILAGLFVLFMLVGIFEPNRSFVTSNRSFVTSELLDANLHHFYLFDHLCK